MYKLVFNSGAERYLVLLAGTRENFYEQLKRYK